MFRREMLLLGSLAVIVFAVVALATYQVARLFHQDASMLAMDTIPGLANAGRATDRMQQNWQCMNQAVCWPAGPDRVALIQQVRTNSNEGFWQQYSTSIYDAEDQHLFDNLQASRSDYLKLREDFVRLLETAPLGEATQFMKAQLTPAYERYKAASESLFDLNVRVGYERANRVIRWSQIMPLALGGLGVLLFASGVLMGMRGALSGMSLTLRLGQGRFNPPLPTETKTTP